MHAERLSRTCEWTTETPGPLDLTESAGRAHLRGDAESAETRAIHYADVSLAPQAGKMEYARVRDECMASLFAAVARTHSVNIAIVRAHTIQRDILFDAVVLVSFGAVYVLAGYAIATFITRRFAADGWRVSAIAVIALSLGTATAAMMVGDLWSTAAEALRLGRGHLSYRVERLPWRQHRGLFFAGSLGLFWVVSILQFRRAVARRTSDRVRDNRID